MARSTDRRRAKPKESFAEIVKTVVYAVLIAVGIRTVAYEPFNIPSASMLPTLLVGDYLFVAKWAYGYSRHSMPFSPPLMLHRRAMLPSAPVSSQMSFRPPPSAP